MNDTFPLSEKEMQSVISDWNRSEHENVKLRAELSRLRVIADRRRVRLFQTERELESYQGNHCVDCCCARSWKALGNPEYDGQDIPQHIVAISADLARVTSERDEWIKVAGEVRILEKHLDLVKGDNDALRARVASLEYELRNVCEAGAQVEDATSSPVYDDLPHRIERAVSDLGDAVYNARKAMEGEK